MLPWKDTGIAFFGYAQISAGISDIYTWLNNLLSFLHLVNKILGWSAACLLYNLIYAYSLYLWRWHACFRLVVQRIGYEHPQHVPHSVQLAHMSGELSLLPRGGAACLLSRETPRNMKPSDRPKKVCSNITSKTVLSSITLPFRKHLND